MLELGAVGCLVGRCVGCHRWVPPIGPALTPASVAGCPPPTPRTPTPVARRLPPAPRTPTPGAGIGRLAAGRGNRALRWSLDTGNPFEWQQPLDGAVQTLICGRHVWVGECAGSVILVGDHRLSVKGQARFAHGLPPLHPPGRPWTDSRWPPLWRA